MNLLIAVNVIVFATVFSLFALETGVALLNLLSYEKYGKKTTYYIARSWAISGTFIIFYVVNFEATFPTLLTAAGTLYIVPVLLAGMLIIFRNAFIAYSDYAGGAVDKKTYTTVYAIATIAAVLILLSALSSTVTGTGISLNSLSVNYLQMFINPYNILMLICAAAVSLAAAIIFFNIDRPFGIGKSHALARLLIVAVGSFAYSSLFYAPFIVQGLLMHWYYIVPSIAILAIISWMYLSGRDRSLNIAAFLWLVATVAGFETLEHPNIFGGMLSIDTFVASQGEAFASLLITCVTVAVLVIGLSILVYAQGKSTKKARKY